MARNLRGAPLYLRASVVRGLVDDLAAIRKGLAAVEILPTKLVDQPQPSVLLIPNAAGAADQRGTPDNDDSDLHDGSDAIAPIGDAGAPCAPESAPVLQADGCEPEPAPEDWPDLRQAQVERTPLPDHADPDLDRAEQTPAEIEVSSCSRAPVKESGLDAMAQGESASPIQRVMAAIGAEKRSPHPEKPLRNLARRRKEAAAQDAPAPKAERLAVIRQVAQRLSPPSPKNDWARVAQAHRGAARKPKPAARPLFPAPGRDECPRCGIPGWKGCAHFLPCEDPRPIAKREVVDAQG